MFILQIGKEKRSFFLSFRMKNSIHLPRYVYISNMCNSYLIYFEDYDYGYTEGTLSLKTVISN